MDPLSNKAKTYQRKKQLMSLFSMVLTPAILLLLVITPLSLMFKGVAESLVANSYGIIACYFVFLSLYTLIFDFPISYYTGYSLEHQYGLSNQSLGDWAKTLLKKSALSFVLSLGLILGLYALIWNLPTTWWLWAWGAYVFLSYVLGKIFPVFIVPLFYKYSRVENDGLRERILKMVAEHNLPVENVYSLNLSKTTKKANAAFMGMGKTKRVVLSDTLIDNFSEDEIATVVAHELGHYKHKDILKQLVLGSFLSLIIFYFAFRVMGALSGFFGYAGIGDIASLPLVFLVFYLASILFMPMQNGLARGYETAADRFALKTCPDKNVFISCMEKLAKINLADVSPHPVYEWFFYDHPSISKRIQMARNEF